ncbi:unnamed protein product [Phaedon cochleariae]|uniref:Uncharacterized protein n=1 Tax=Phaedon cochleariae TaxID=80249 RepID=A0A9N9WZN4_PHACE|nr:unnamed protein product [Phaedon cochleariae]
MGEDKSISNQEIYQILLKLSSTCEHIQKQNEDIRSEVQECRETFSKEIEELKAENKKLREEVENLNRKVNAVERKLKTFNVIFYGLKEEEGEFKNAQFLLEIINNKLNTPCKSKDIRDYYRIRSKDSEQNNPLIVGFIHYKLVTSILENSSKLKGSGIFVSKDYIQEDYQKRKYLYSKLREAKHNRKEARIKNNTLIIDGVEFTYEDLVEKEQHISQSDIEVIERKEASQKRKKTAIYHH